MHEALDASRLANEGWDIQSIRSYIDRKYRS